MSKIMFNMKCENCGKYLDLPPDCDMLDGIYCQIAFWKAHNNNKECGIVVEGKPKPTTETPSLMKKIKSFFGS